MKSKTPSLFLCHALVSLIAVLVIGFLGLGVRAFATADNTKVIFLVAFVIFVVILVLHFMLRRPAILRTEAARFGIRYEIEKLTEDLAPVACLQCVPNGAALLHAGCHDESVKDMKRKRVPPILKNVNRLGEGRRVGAKPEASMTLVAEGDRRHKGQGEFWVEALAMAGTIAASKLGVALYSQIVRLLN